MIEEEVKKEAAIVHKKRTSSRVKKLSAAMRIVDAETRKAVMQARIDGLEGDNLFGQSGKPTVGDEEDYQLE